MNFMQPKGTTKCPAILEHPPENLKKLWFFSQGGNLTTEPSIFTVLVFVSLICRLLEQSFRVGSHSTKCTWQEHRCIPTLFVYHHTPQCTILQTGLQQPQGYRKNWIWKLKWFFEKASWISYSQRTGELADLPQKELFQPSRRGSVSQEMKHTARIWLVCELSSLVMPYFCH